MISNVNYTFNDLYICKHYIFLLYFDLKFILIFKLVTVIVIVTVTHIFVGLANNQYIIIIII